MDFRFDAATEKLRDSLLAFMDEKIYPAEHRHRYLTTVLWVSVTSMTARRVSAGQRRGRLIFLCP